MAPKNNEHFATTVRETMSRLGLTQAGVMERGGPSDTTLRKILDNEPVGISTLTLKKLDDAFGWDAGSAAATLSGGQPTVTTEIRGGEGDRLRLIYGGEDSAQESLELIRLAQIVHDARDVAQSQSGPFMTALAALLDEAAELVTRVVARVEDDGRENAEWYIEQARANNNIRRQGDIYVIDNEGDTHVDTTTPTRAPGETHEGEKTLGGLGRRRANVRPTAPSDDELPPIEFLAAESGGPKGVDLGPDEEDFSQDPADHDRNVE